MAKLKGLNAMVGSMKNISMYTIQGSDEIYIRTKGGASKSKIKRSPSFEKVRLNNNEWVGCTKLTRAIRGGLYAMNRFEDYPVSGALNALAKSIQKEDRVSAHGQRIVALSKYKEVVNGFNFSRKQTLESVLRIPIRCQFDRMSMSAGIEIPPINTRTALYNQRDLPFFRIVMGMCPVPDFLCNEEKKNYYPSVDNFLCIGTYREGEWFSTHTTTPAQQFSLSYPEYIEELTDEVSLLVAVGIEFGNTGYNNEPVGVKYAGCAKIIHVG